WFNVIILLDDADFSFYCNSSSPCTYTHPRIQYIDFDIDFLVQKDFTFEIVDLDEYEINKQRYSYPPAIQQSIERGIHQLQDLIESRTDPFNEQFIQKWYDTYARWKGG